MISKTDKARLEWHCRRGMLELDLILMPFARNNLESMSEEQIKLFDKLLGFTDPELFSWLMGYELPPEKDILEIVEFIQLKHQP